MIDLAYALGQAPSGSPNAGGPMSGIISLLPFVGIFLIFYFLMIRPQQKQRKEREAILASVKTGDEVLTSGGLFGVVKSFGEENQRVKLQIAPNVQVEVSRASIASVIGSTLVKKDREKDKEG